MTAERFRAWVSRILIAGVAISAGLIATGFIGALLVGWTGSLVGAAQGTSDPTDFSSVVSGLGALRPIAIAQAGLLALIATPVARVGISLVAFVLERDRLYAVITAAVLGLLLLSLLVVR